MLPGLIFILEVFRILANEADLKPIQNAFWRHALIISDNGLTLFYSYLLLSSSKRRYRQHLIADKVGALH